MNLHAMSHRAWALGALGLALAGAVHAADTAPEATASAAGIFMAVEGEVLLILEAMKMETEIRAAQAGTVRGIAVKAGDAVAVGDTLLQLA